MIIQAIKAFNKWYDGVQEPFRFLIALALVLPGLAALTAGTRSIGLLGAAWLVAILFTRIYPSLGEKG